VIVDPNGVLRCEGVEGLAGLRERGRGGAKPPNDAPAIVVDLEIHGKEKLCFNFYFKMQIRWAPRLFFHLGFQMSTLNFATRAEFVVFAADGSASPGSVVSADGFLYRFVADSTAIVDLPGWVPQNVTWVEHFGSRTVQSLVRAEKDTTDNSPAIQSAIDYQTSRDGGEVRFSDGYYRLESTLTITQKGVDLIGNDSNSSKLYGDFVGGPILHIRAGSCGVNRLGFLASSSRSGSSDVRDVGLRFQVEDVEGTLERLKATVVEDVRVQQPSHGIVISNAFTGTLSRVWAINNGGHGIVVDRGFAYPMETHENVAGLCSFNECQLVGNIGHGLALGHPEDEFTTQALRMVVNNCEISKNATNPDVRYEDAQVYCRATEVMFIANVFKPVPGSGSSGVYIAGRCITMNCNRFIDVRHVALIGSYDKFPTVGVYITGFNVISSPLMESAVRVTRTAGQTSEAKGISVTNYNFSGGVDTLVDTDMGGGLWRAPLTNVGGMNLTLAKLTDQSSTLGTTLVDDDDLRFWVTPGERVNFVVTLEYTCDPSVDFSVSVRGPGGSSLRFCPTGGSFLSTSNEVRWAPVAENGGRVNFGSTDAVHRIATLRGFVADVSEAGAVVVSWGQVRTPVKTVVVYSGLSCLEVTRVPK